MQTPSQQLKAAYPQLIDRLADLYSLGLQHTLTEAELAEIDELRQRALMIHTELAQRDLLPTLIGR